jgi:hypothetical protein
MHVPVIARAEPAGRVGFPAPAAKQMPIQRARASLSGAGGEPLDAATRDHFERRFQWDFGSVRVHTDDRAARLAAGVGARAYTVGADITFGTAERPGVNALTAHELAHVVQNGLSGDRLTIRRAPARFSIVSRTFRVVLPGYPPYDFVVVQIRGGPRRAFYFRTGTGFKGEGFAPPPRSWAPFHGLDPQRRDPERFRLDKDSFYREFETPELRGYGSAENKEIADWLKTQKIAPAEELPWREAQAELSEALKASTLAPVAPAAVTASGEIHTPSTGPGGGGAPPVPEVGSGAGTIEEEAVSFGKVESATLKIGSFLEAALPGPQDVLFLWIGFFGSIAEAQAKLREEAYNMGFSEGLAANLLGLGRDWVNERLIAHVHGEEAEGFKGARAGGNNQGVVDGYRFAGRLTGEQRLAFWYQGRHAARAKGDADALRYRPFNLDDVVTLGIALQPTVMALLEVAREQERERELREQLKYERAFGPRFRH